MKDFDWKTKINWNAKINWKTKINSLTLPYAVFEIISNWTYAIWRHFLGVLNNIKCHKNVSILENRQGSSPWLLTNWDRNFVHKKWIPVIDLCYDDELTTTTGTKVKRSDWRTLKLVSHPVITNDTITCICLMLAMWKKLRRGKRGFCILQIA